MSIPSAFLGLLDEFLKYSRHEQSKWLIDIAHDICDPAAKCGSLFDWSEAAQLWRPVAHTDALTAFIYRYDVPLGVISSLSKISQYSCWKIRHHRDRKREHRDCARRRDRVCWATILLVSYIALSHQPRLSFPICLYMTNNSVSASTQPSIRISSSTK
jgi:hypothetical protein